MTYLVRPEGNLPGDLHLSRRGVAASLFFAGYAAAAFSAEAQPIQTPATGLITEEVRLSSGIPAYVARPERSGRYACVIVVSEIFGIHEHIRDVCRRFARLGYVAIAPAFFVRVADPAGMTEFAEIRRVVEAASDPQVLGDIASALSFLHQRSYARADRVAVTGFCWGGGVTWLACQEGWPEIKAGVAWYGRMARPPGTPDDPNRFWPMERVSRLSAPVLGLYAERDGITAAVEPMRAALAAAGKADSEIIVYPGAQHGFHADYRPTYNAAAARDGWTRTLMHFRRHGVTPAFA